LREPGIKGHRKAGKTKQYRFGFLDSYTDMFKYVCYCYSYRPQPVATKPDRANGKPSVTRPAEGGKNWWTIF